MSRATNAIGHLRKYLSAVCHFLTNSEISISMGLCRPDEHPRGCACSGIIEVSGDEMASLLAAIAAEEAARAGKMPDDKAAIAQMFEAYRRLRELGWQPINASPQDGSSFQAIEIGSTGIFDAYYVGDWPDGDFFVDDGTEADIGHPVMFRRYPEDEARHRAKMAAAAAHYRAELEAADAAATAP